MTAEIQLWPDGAPGSEGATQVERVLVAPDGEERVVNVTVPTLTPVLPEAASETAVVVAPGGGYRMLSMDSEGRWVAQWLRERGIAAHVLKYRLEDTGATDADLMASFQRGLRPGPVDTEALAPTARPLARADGERAVRHLRGEGFKTVGFIGFSAGGMVATDVALSDDADARPDFVAPIYGAAVKGAVPADAPPFFSIVCSDDPLCLDLCIDAYRAWRAADRPAELHVYAKGGHGFGLRKQGLPADSWIDRFGDWLDASSL